MAHSGVSFSIRKQSLKLRRHFLEMVKVDEAMNERQTEKIDQVQCSKGQQYLLSGFGRRTQKGN